MGAHSQDHQQICEISTDNFPVNEGQTQSLPVVILSPAYLPLLGLSDLAKTIDSSQSLWVRNGLTQETIAVIVGATRAASLAKGKSLHVDDLVSTSEIVDIDPSQLIIQGADLSSLVSVKDDWYRPQTDLSRLAAVRVDWAQWTAAELALPLWFVKKIPAPLGALARVMDPDEIAPNTPTVAKRSWSLSDIDVVAVTTDRFQSVKELVRSIRRVLGEDPGITVVVQSNQNNRWDRLARRFSAKFLYVEYDLGLSAARNVAVRATDRPLVLLMDDDFQLDERCRLDGALTILNHHPEISVLGGNLLDVHHWSEGRDKEVSQGFAMKLLDGPPNLTWLRLEDAPRLRQFLNPTDYFEYCDVVDNFALMRRDHVFDRGVWWNEELKIGAEHQEFFLRLKQHPSSRVARTNALKVRNVRVQSARFRRLRYRTSQFFPLFFQSWNLLTFTIIGERTRVRASDGGHAYFERPHLRPVYVGKGAVS